MAEVDMDFGSSLQNLPSNSNKSKMEKKQSKSQEKRKIEPIINDGIRLKKKGPLKRIKGSMLSEDAHNIGGYIIKEIVLPTIKDLIYNSAHGALEIALYGSPDTRNKKRNVPYNSLNQYGQQNVYRYNGTTSQSSRREKSVVPPQNWFNVYEAEFPSRAVAEEALSNLRIYLEEYGNVSVREFYENLNMTAPYTSDNYGWTDLSTATTHSYMGKWYIDLPEPKPLKNIN